MRDVRDIMRITQQPDLAGEARRRGGRLGARRLRRGRVRRVALRDRIRRAAPRERLARARLRCRGASARSSRCATGIVGGRSRTLEEVGRAFNITRERVRQIENRTLKKLQTLPEAQQLREAS